MIFDNEYNNIKKIAEEAAKNSGFDSGFILMCDYQQQNPIQEVAGFYARDIGYYPSNKFTRLIIIGRSSKSGHTGRMKVTVPIKINNKNDKIRNNPITTDHDNTFSFYVSNEINGIVEHEYKEDRVRYFEFAQGEVAFYDDLCRRNWNLIKLAKTPGRDNILQNAFIHDELWRLDNKPFIRYENGDIKYIEVTRNQYGAPVYHEIIEDLYGKRISDTIVRRDTLL